MKRFWMGCLVLGMVLGAEVKAGTLSLTCDLRGPAEQGSVTEVMAVVANSGTEDIGGVVCEITLPNDISGVELIVDGTTSTFALTYNSGTISTGGSSTFIWRFKLFTLGINNITVKAKDQTKTGKKWCHRIGSLFSKIAVVNQEANENTAVLNLLSEMGLSCESVPITNVSSNMVEPSDYPAMIIYCHDSGLTSLTLDSFKSAIRNYMEKGGNILFLGTAPKLLDEAKITYNAFTLNTVYVLGNFWGGAIKEVYVSIGNIGHPITEGYSAGQDIQVNYSDMWLAYGSR